MPDENTIAAEQSSRSEQAKELEQLAVAADYLGYPENSPLWSHELIQEKKVQLRAKAEFMAAFGDESRLEIFILLMHSPAQNGQMPSFTVSEIAERFNISMSTVSHHLQELKRVGIVKMERSGKERYYQIDLEFLIDQIGTWHKRLLDKKNSLQPETPGK